MYCNKCGNEIAENVTFCSRCGEKVDVKQREVKMAYVSVCSKCGQEAEGSMRFCTHCGGEIIKKETYPTTDKGFAPVSSGSTVLNNAAKNFIGLIGVALLGILALVYLVTSIKSFDGNSEAFEWISDGYKTLGIILHWGICAISVAECVNCVVRVMTSGTKGKHLIQTSVSMLVTTVMIWIGTMIWNDFDFEDLSIVLYRIFGTYGQIVSVSFVLLIVTLICGVLCAKAEQE